MAQATDCYRRDPREWLHFAHVNRWITAWRYDPDPASAEDASSFLDGVEHVPRWIKANI